MRLEHKTALITGSSRNIGKAIALAFAREGADLVLNTRVNREELDAVAKECEGLGVRTLPIICDISNPVQVSSMVEQGISHFGKIDILVSNAAIRPHKPISDVSLEEWHRVIGVNLHSCFYLCKAATPSMMERCQGSIIALGGVASMTGRPNSVAVTASKTGLLGFIRALAAELGPHGIRANMVMPGSTDTERRYPEWYPEFKEIPRSSQEHLSSIPLGRQGRPEEVASTCLFLASDESSYVTGSSLVCAGGSFIG